jgi:DNA-binding transcriptional LysR family regulator
MTISQYDIFIKVVELGNLTRAAETLGYTQSGISHALQALEAECGFTLLLRSRSGVQLTAAGTELLPYFQALSKERHNLHEKLSEMNRMKSGLIRIGTFTSVSSHWLPGIIAAFHEDYPGIEFELLHATNKLNEERVLSGRVDCAFLKAPVAKGIQCHYLSRDPIVAILPENHPLAELNAIPLTSLASEPYVKLDEGEEDELISVFKEQGLVPCTKFTEMDDYAVMAMVEQGLGVSLLPQLSLSGSTRHIAVRPLKKPAYRDLGIGIRASSTTPASVKLFIQYADDWVSKHHEMSK